MTIAENKLRELIRNIITEKRNNKKLNAPIDSRILKQVEKMDRYNYSIFVEDKENYLNVSMFKMDYVRTSSQERKTNKRKRFNKKHREKVGSVIFLKYGANRNVDDARSESGKNPLGIKVGGSKRKGAWYVVNSDLKDHNELGLGPIMYEVGIEYISRFKNCVVMADSSVSDSAINVWKKFDNRTDFEKYQFDIDLNTSIDSNNLMKSISQITSNDNSDDVGFNLINLIYHSKENDVEEFKKSWFKSPLTRGFFNNKGRVIKLLHSKDLIFKV